MLNIYYVIHAQSSIVCGNMYAYIHVYISNSHTYVIIIFKSLYRSKKYKKTISGFTSFYTHIKIKNLKRKKKPKTLQHLNF